MCFSPEVSFSTAAALLPAGVYCVQRAWQRDRRYLALAAVPFLFAVQQFFEGLVWSGLRTSDVELTKAGALAYLSFALWLWPFWAPFGFAFTKEGIGARRDLWLLAAGGLAFGAALYLPIALDHHRLLQVTVVRHSIRYDFGDDPAFAAVAHGFWQASYLALVFVPLLASPNRSVRTLTILLAISAAISYFAFWYAAVSVWCFFAAALSAQFCWVFYTLPRRERGRVVVATE